MMNWEYIGYSIERLDNGDCRISNDLGESLRLTGQHLSQFLEAIRAQSVEGAKTLIIDLWLAGEP